ncbi:NYN domain-containing protein [Alkaliphilus hydrothermalis]|uniref:RNA-binding protein with PIN domain n=1 Tax=Alkaliphilus hydrothermalis TaxID=1482730 RepID=A0ABS2NR64_9FIRM|nr:NYN domain-containing protein [Alkaliphilus hydrothermalis]MBM7615321.1 putative RNA-binding protein with PIN domain [Alkaliphilus hydrothermalis]
MKEYLLIDGYNVINAWPYLREICHQDLDEARNALIEIMMEYQSLKAVKIIVVFDAHLVRRSRGKSEKIKGVEVVFTKERETADGYIERKVIGLIEKRNRVVVATNDWLEQQMVLGGGATRISVRELIADYEHMKARVGKKTRENTLKKEEISNRLDSSVLEKLEKFRRKL